MNRTIQKAMTTGMTSLQKATAAGMASIIQGKQLCIVLAGECVQEGVRCKKRL